MPENPKEKIMMELSVSAAAGLKRLARYYQVTQEEIVERLIKKADSSAAEEATRQDEVKGQRMYYDGPRL